MNNIDKENFLNKFIIDYDGYSEVTGVLPVTSDLISEFKIGKKFVYRIREDSSLVALHDRLLKNFLNLVPLNKSATAFLPNKSYLNFIEPHRDNYDFMRLDLKNFFHSIDEKLLKNAFSSYFKYENINSVKQQKVIESFINAVSYQVPENSQNKTYVNKIILPIGFKTSPVISNIIFRKIDFLIEDYCSKNNITYTRYADDMLFSSRGHIAEFDPFSAFFKYKHITRKNSFLHSSTFFNEIKFLVKLDGFKINDKKTIRSRHTISLKGYTVEGTNFSDKKGSIRISNKKTYIIEKMIFEIKKGTSHTCIMKKLFNFKMSQKHFKYLPPKTEFADKYCKDQLLNKLLGYRSYLISMIKFNSSFNCFNQASINKYTALIKSMNDIIESSAFK